MIMTIITMFAQIPAPSPTNAELGLWIACFNVVATLVIGAVVIWKSFSNRAERREVSIVADAVGKTEFIRHEQKQDTDINSLHTKIGASERETRAMIAREMDQLRVERREDMESLNDQIGDLRTASGKLSAETNLQNERLVQIDSKLDRLIESERRHR